MKRAVLIITALVFSAALVTAQNATQLFQQALQKERAEGDLPGAIRIYERIIKDFPSDRVLVARATLQLGLCNERLGQAKAREYFQQVISRFADQPDLVSQARSRLDAANPGPIRFAMPYSSDCCAFAISPDGRSIVYTGTTGEKSQLWLRRIDSEKAERIPGTETFHSAWIRDFEARADQPAGLMTNPFWSPDGRSIGFFADGKLKRVDLGAREVRTVADAPQNLGGTWNADGVIVFAPTPEGLLYRVSATAGGSKPEPITSAPGDHRYPTFLPGGQHVLYIRNTGPANFAEVRVASLDGSGSRVLGGLRAHAVAFAPPDHLLFVQNGVLSTQSLDLMTLELKGSPVRVLDRVDTGVVGKALLAISSSSGAIAYRANGGSAEKHQLIWIDRQGRQTGSLGAADAMMGWDSPRFSPDGRKVAVMRFNPNSALILDASTGGALATWGMDSGLGSSRSPVWHPDGRAVAHPLKSPNSQVGFFQLWQIRDGGPSTPFFQSREDKVPEDWSPDGRFLLFTKFAPEGGDLLVAPARADETPIPITTTGAWERNGRFSPDGRWIAYQSDEVRGRNEIFVQPFPGTIAERVQVSSSGGRSPQWSRDGLELFFLSPDNHLMGAAVTSASSGGPLRVAKPMPVFSSPLRDTAAFTPSPDGQRFLVNMPVEPAPPLYVLSNWASTLSSALSAPASVAPVTQPGRPNPNAGNTVPARATAYGQRVEIGVFDRQGNLLKTIPTDGGTTGRFNQIKFSPDGSRISYHSFDGTLWNYELATDVQTPIAPRAVAGTWSPDGSQFAYRATRDNGLGIYTKPSNGAGAEEFLYGPAQMPLQWTPDNRFLLMVFDNNVLAVPLTGKREPISLFRWSTNIGAKLSSDGRFVAVVSNENGSSEVWVRPFELDAVIAGKNQDSSGWKLSNQGATELVRWRNDNKELYYLARNGDMMAVSIETTPEFQPQPPRLLFKTPDTFPLSNPAPLADISGDGERFVFLLSVPDPVR